MIWIINRRLKAINRYAALIISILFALRVGAETNSSFNIDFESATNLQGWTVSGNSNIPSNIARIVGAAEVNSHSGKQCVAITAWQKAGNDLRTIITSQDKIPVAPGYKIRIALWARSKEPAMTLSVIGACYDESGKGLSTDWPVFKQSLTSEWTKVECETRVYNKASKSFGMSLDVIGPPGTVYVDDLSITVIPGTLSDFFTKINLVDNTPMMELSAEQKEQGYILFKRSYLDIVYPAVKPKKAEIVKSIAIFAAPGEYEPATVSIHTLKELKNVTVKVTDLRAADGKVIASANITVGSVRCLNKREGYGTGTFYADMPTFIEQKNAVNLAANISHTFWLTVKIPEDAVAGVYSGKINITCDNGKPSEIQLKCKVLPFKLAPVPKGKYYSLYYQAGALKDLIPPAVAFKDMQEHGSTGVGLCWISALPDYSKVVWDGTNATIDIPSTNLFAQVVEEYKKVFSEPILWLTTPEDFEGYALKYGGPIGSPEFATLYKALVKSIVAYGKGKGWPEFIFQSQDEPGWYNEAAPERKKSLTMNKLLKEAGVRVELNGPNNDYLFKESAPYVDLFTSTTFPSKEEMAELHKQGKRVILYNVEESGYHPERIRLLLGFHMWSRDGDGIANWTYCNTPYGDVYDDLDAATADLNYRYWPSGKETGGPSTSFEGLREGIDDYRYLVTLNQAINELRQSSKKSGVEKAETIQKELDKILDSIAFSHSRLGYWNDPNDRPNFRWRKEYRDKAGNLCYEGPWKVRNGWSLEDYDKARWRVACLIMEAKGLQ